MVRDIHAHRDITAAIVTVDIRVPNQTRRIADLAQGATSDDGQAPSVRSHSVRSPAKTFNDHRKALCAFRRVLDVR